MANEVRLIDANWILGEIDHDLGCYEIGELAEEDGLYVELRDVVKMVRAAPTIDPESLRPKGRWVYDDGNLEWACSECLRAAHVNLGAISGYILSDFCPNCGAKMEG